MDYTVARVFNDDFSESYLVSTKLDSLKQIFSLEIIHNNSAWTSEIIEKDLDKFACLLRLELKTYIQKIRTAFDGSDNGFSLAINDNKLLINHKVEKQEYGIFQLKECNFNKVAENIVDISLESKKEFEDKLSSLESRVKELTTRNENYESLIKSFTEEKLLNDKIIKKFMVLLDAKKDRIRQLYDILEDRLTVHKCQCIKNKLCTEFNNENIVESDSIMSKKQEPITPKVDEKRNENNSTQDIFNNEVLLKRSFPNTKSTLLDFQENPDSVGEWSNSFKHNFDNMLEESSKKLKSSISHENDQHESQNNKEKKKFSTQDLLNDIL